ncbi:glutathione S-transferase family protein [Tardiphaga sp. vice304]|uniref:glutathione S-transferase family protein n=1 Tax=Tardiphaga sp. vice304 TaxID=2592817 RepID=UPI001163E3FA|nr:glutathione S-transferase family protein [Tardiphaga sp. vice304]QDM25940.1 glutathione S-transferase family protein [Tardiphaga sp. vice304]
MLHLYHALISTCSQKVRLVLAEKGLEWIGTEINFGRGDHLSADYLKLNPNGVVPTLLHDDHPIIESSVINEYLDEAFPDNSVRPKNLRRLAHMRAWRQYIDEVPTPSIRPISFNTFFVPIWSKMTEEEFLAYTERLPLRKHFYRKMGRKGFSQEEMEASIERLNQTIDRMEVALENGLWIVGDQYTLADVSLTPTIVRLEDCGRSDLWDRRPRVAGWLERIKTRPNFDVAYVPGSRDLGPHN